MTVTQILSCHAALLIKVLKQSVCKLLPNPSSISEMQWMIKGNGIKAHVQVY